MWQFCAYLHLFWSRYVTGELILGNYIYFIYAWGNKIFMMLCFLIHHKPDLAPL